MPKLSTPSTCIISSSSERLRASKLGSVWSCHDSDSSGIPWNPHILAGVKPPKTERFMIPTRFDSTEDLRDFSTKKKQRECAEVGAFCDSTEDLREFSTSKSEEECTNLVLFAKEPRCSQFSTRHIAKATSKRNNQTMHSMWYAVFSYPWSLAWMFLCLVVGMFVGITTGYLHGLYMPVPPHPWGYP